MTLRRSAGAMASASIGQVHRARARDGRDLALKIQYPGVARSIESDVDNVAALLRLFNLLPPDDIPDNGKQSHRNKDVPGSAERDKSGGVDLV